MHCVVLPLVSLLRLRGEDEQLSHRWPFLSTFLPPPPFSDLFTQSSHLSCYLPRLLQTSCFFVSDLFGNLPSFILTMCSAHLIRLFTILPTIQAFIVPTLGLFQSPLHSLYTGYSPYSVTYIHTYISSSALVGCSPFSRSVLL